jgi:transposase
VSFGRGLQEALLVSLAVDRHCHVGAIRQTMHVHRKGILAFYDYRISTGPLEATNTKIQAMKRQANGFRHHEFFKLKILAIHQTKYALVG